MSQRSNDLCIGRIGRRAGAGTASGCSLRLRGASFALLIFGAWSFGQSGCAESGPPGGSHAGTDESAAVANPRDAVAGPLALYHDFGLMRPNTTAACSFVVTNPTRQPWTIRDIKRSCNCTVVDVSQARILPGQRTEIGVSYRAPAQPSDEERTVRIALAEEGAPGIALIVRATVRPPLTISPTELHFPEIVAGHQAQRDVMVFNFSDRHWPGLELSGTPQWLRATVAAIPDLHETRSGPMPNQAWRVSLAVLSAGLQVGDHRGALSIRPSDDPEEATVLPVSVRFPSAIRAVPDRLFFGYLRDRTPIERTVVVVLADGLSAVASEDIRITNDLGPEISCSWRQSPAHGKFRHLIVTFTPSAVLGRIAASLSLSLPGHRERFDIPLSAVLATAE